MAYPTRAVAFSLVQCENFDNLTDAMRGKIGWIRKIHRKLRLSINLRREKGKKIERAKIIEIVLLLLTFISITGFAWFNYRLLKGQQEWQERTRKNDVAPVIQLATETGFNQKSFEQATIVFENIGKGIALNIWLLIGDAKGIYVIEHEFEPLGNGPSQNYIKPGEKLKVPVAVVNIFGEEFSSKSKEEKMNMSIGANWTFYFSYFDVEGNEYWLVLTERPAGVRGYSINYLRNTHMDSLLKSLPRSRRKIYRDFHLREESGFIKKEWAK